MDATVPQMMMTMMLFARSDCQPRADEMMVMIPVPTHDTLMANWGEVGRAAAAAGRELVPVFD